MSEFIHAPSSDFPSDILKWMKVNAKPKMALKLMKCHKYFQHQTFPFLVVKNVEISGDWDQITLDNQTHKNQGAEFIQNLPQKLWLIGNLYLFHTLNIIPTLISKIAVCDITNLRIENENLLFNEFKYLTSGGKIKELYMEWIKINLENGDPVFIPDILKCLPNIENFYHYKEGAPVFSSNFNEAMKEINVSNLKEFGLFMISYQHFLIFLKFINQNPHIKYRIYFTDNSLTSEETFQVEEYVQGIIDAGLTKYPPPEITFRNQNHKQLDALYLLSDQYNLKKGK